MNLLHTTNPGMRADHMLGLRAMESQFQRAGANVTKQTKEKDGAPVTRAFVQTRNGWKHAFKTQMEEPKPEVEVKEVLIDIPKLPKIPCGVPNLVSVRLPAESNLECFENETRKMSDTIGELESKLEELESKMTTLGAAVVSIKQYSELTDGMGRQSVEQLRQINNLNDSENEIERLTRWLKNLFGI